MRIAWMFIVLGLTGWAQGVQNMEYIGMVGGVHSSASIVEGTNTVLSGSSGFTFQINYAYQVKSTKAGNLWIETPFTYTFQGTGAIAGTSIAGFSRDITYITPGVRLKSPTFGRVSFYGAAGGGYAGFWRIDGLVTGQNGTVTAAISFHPSAIFDYAGGIDVRLSRLVSLRAEGRDFFSAANLGGVTGHNHPVFLIGLAFHR
jgi:hypothetical protein